MITLTDDRIVNQFNQVFGIDFNRMVYGQLNVAEKYWIRYNEKQSGISYYPFLSFYHRIASHDNFKNWDSFQAYNDAGDMFLTEFVKIKLNYVVEIIGNRVIDQINYMRNYLLWVSKSPNIQVVDNEGVTWYFGVVPEDPEDNSDLEEEEEKGRIVRTTFNFAVDSLIRKDNNEEATPYITEILSRIHLYGSDNISNESTETIKIEE